MAQEQQPNVMEQCLVTLTAILARNNQPQTWRSRIEGEVRYLPTFKGDPGTLPSFIDAINRSLEAYGDQADQVFQIIYNTKIQGAAKNILSVQPPTTWNECREKLRKHYKPSKDQMTITRTIGSLTVAPLLIMLLSIQLAQGFLLVNPIQEETGYIQIKLREVTIINDTNTVLHTVNPVEINNIVTQIEDNVNKMYMNNKNITKAEIRKIKAKIRSIMPNNIRSKRGVFNFMGTAQKWLYGTMDESDREEILGHLKVIEENNHNAITTLNKQITINIHFNETINLLKNTIEEDRSKLLVAFNSLKNSNTEIINQAMYLDQMVKLRYLEDKIN